MKQTGKSRRRRLVVAITAAMLGAACLAAAADLFVQRDTLDLMDSPGALGNVAATLNQNTRLQELERTDDGWVKVQTRDGKQGYVLADAVGNSPAKALGIGKVGSNSGAEMSTSLAARGLEPEAEDYSRSKNYDKTALNKVIALNKTVNDAQYWQFGKDGKVGPGKPKQK
jgi:uncharacterized protein YgiM (DUF1202 family)